MTMTSTYNLILLFIVFKYNLKMSQTNHRAVLASQDIIDSFEIRTDYEYRSMFNRLLTRKIM